MEMMTFIFILVGVIAFSQDNIVERFHDRISLFSNFSFHKLVAFIIIIIAGFIAYIMYTDQLEKERKSINLILVFAPLAGFILVYILGEYGTQYLVNAFLLFLGFWYLQKGVEQKDVLKLMLASFAIIGSLAIRLTDFTDYLDDRFMIGILALIFGGISIALGWYMRSKWMVTGTSNSNEELKGLE